MNPNAQFERDLAQWLQAEAPASAPAGFHASVMDRARTLRQRPGWTTTLPVRRFGRGRDMTLLAAAALLLVGGALAGSGLLRLPTVVPPVPAPSVVAVATASPDATSPTPSQSAAPSARPIPVAGPGGVWIPTGSMGKPSFDHIAVRLADGRVLVAGGSDGSRPGEEDQRNLTSAGLYDPVSGTWSATGNMLKPQEGFPPTLLRDGRILFGGLARAASDVSTIGAEVYDPQSGTWSATGPLVGGAAVWGSDSGSSATMLRDGKVLVASQGGVEVYDPDSGTWSATGNMITPRHSHTATLLRDGKVLVAGGYDGGDYTVDAAELYDPDTGSWTAIANTHRNGRPKCLGCGGYDGWAILLQDGTVLFMRRSSEAPFAEIYDPAAGTWTVLAQPTELGYRTATLLSDGTVLVAGPYDPEGPPQPCTAAALYSPRTGSWTTAPSLRRCASGSSFTPLLDGTVLVAGGRDCNGDGACVTNGAAELYVPAGVPLPRLPAFPSPLPPAFPSPTPVPTPLPPASGPVPPNARSWKVSVDNRSSEPATLFVAEDDGNGLLRLVGSATPNVVPAGATVQVTFRFPTDDDGWIYVNARPGEGGSLVSADQIGIPGKIVITAEGDGVWASP